MSNPKSTASIAGHPIHPMLVPFPIAFFVATSVCDLAYWLGGNPFWFRAAIWLLGAGLVTGFLAALAGLIDALGDQQIRALRDLWWHGGAIALVVVIEIGNWLLRLVQGPAAIVPIGLVISLVVVGLLLFAGWKGWEMVYRRRVGVSDAAPASGQAPRPAAPPRVG